MVRCKSPVNLKSQETILRLKPLAQAIALLMMAGNAHAATAFSSSWFAEKGASQAATAARISAEAKCRAFRRSTSERGSTSSWRVPSST
jgi:hypothetical protein